MWIRLSKSSVVGGKKYPIGRVLQVTNDLAKQLLNDKKATEHKDGLPPKKIKTDFFKPKI